MKQLVDEFRDYARLPAAKLAPVDLNALVQEVMVLYGQAIDQGRVQTQLEPRLPSIMGDETQLRQVIHNLVQNSLDAVGQVPNGTVHVQTQCSRGEDGGVRAVRLNVSDNGPGFSDAVLKRAFEPYVTTKTKGTGLGLAVVKKIADEHGARVRLGNGPPANTNAMPLEGIDSRSAGTYPQTGAQVSLSFSKLAPTPVEPAALQVPGSPLSSA
jgi:nitrogen fixation/metabolism regulation signal transduction histidine kinase